MGECLIIKSGGGTDTSNATATKDKILQGYSCYVKDALIKGTILDMTLEENRDTFLGIQTTQSVIDVGPETLNNFWITQNADNLKRVCIRIPKNGYYTTSCHIGIDLSLVKDELLIHASQITSGTPATGDKILTGYAGYANGVKIDGTMPDRGAVMYSLPINGSYTIPAGYHNGNGKITQNIATQGGWTVTPGTGNILACAAGRYVTGTIYCAGSGNLVAGNIRNGVNIFGVVGNFVGWVDNESGRIDPWSGHGILTSRQWHGDSEGWYNYSFLYALKNIRWQGWKYINVRYYNNGARLSGFGAKWYIWAATSLPPNNTSDVAYNGNSSKYGSVLIGYGESGYNRNDILPSGEWIHRVEIAKVIPSGYGNGVIPYITSSDGNDNFINYYNSGRINLQMWFSMT